MIGPLIPKSAMHTFCHLIPPEGEVELLAEDNRASKWRSEIHTRMPDLKALSYPPHMLTARLALLLGFADQEVR